MVFGGAKRDRTADLYNAIVALSQLSYSPFRQPGNSCCLAKSSGLQSRGDATIYPSPIALGKQKGCSKQKS